MGRAPCCDKASVKKGPWSPEEDSKLKSYIEQNGTGGNWIALPQKIGLKRCGKSCRLRWLNYLRPNIKHGGFSEEEDNVICSLFMSIGSRWSIIAAQLPGRTDNDIKNYWNTRLKKKLLGKQRKEQQSLVRRMSSLKQEKKKESPYDNLLLPSFVNPTQYWCNHPVAPPMVNSCQDPSLKDQTSLRNLLIKLGGRFSDPYPITSSLHQDFQSLTQFPTPQYDINSSTSAMFQPSELEVDELIYRDSVQYEGFDCFYGMEMIGSSSATNSGESSCWSEEMKALVHHPLMVSDYELCQRGIPHLDSAFELGFQ